MAVTEQPKGPGFGDFIYDKLFHNYVWRSIFRSGYPNTPRNQMLAVATSVFLHLHPTRIHKTHVRITHTYCLGGLSFFMFLGLTVTGVMLMFYYVPSVDRAYTDVAALDLTRLWPTRAGASQAIATGRRVTAQAWSRAIYRTYPGVAALVYRSSMAGSSVNVALYERASAEISSVPVVHLPLTHPGLALPLERAASKLGYGLR